MSGIFKSNKSVAPVPEAEQPAAKEKAAVAAAAEVAETRGVAEDKSARRRARRGGRAMLSDTRLNPEQGVSTLGSQGL